MVLVVLLALIMPEAPILPQQLQPANKSFVSRRYSSDKLWRQLASVPLASGCYSSSKL